MKAAVYRGKQRLEVEEVPTPRPGPGQVLVKVKYCAICGSDVHRFMYGVMRPGQVMGHELSGVIAEVGEGVQGWKVGDRVVGGGGAPPLGTPPSLSRTPRYSSRTMGYRAVAWGGYAEYILLDAWRPLPIPEGVSDEAAALTEPCAVGVHAVRLSKLRVGDEVAVVGMGPIGLLCFQVARAAGARAVYVSELAPARAQAARELGADAVIDPTEKDVVAEMLALTGGLGPHVVFECAAGPPTLDQSLEMVRRSGQVVVVSLAWEKVEVLPVEWVGREVEMKCSYGSTPEEWQITLDLMKTGKVRVGPLLTEESYVPLDNIQEAFESLMKPTTQIQLVVVP